MIIKNDFTEEDLIKLKADLLGSLLLFTEVFFKLRTGREFIISQPDGRESHHIVVCRELTKIQRGSNKLLKIHIPPRYGKTELLIHFVAWSLARYPSSNFMYVSYSHELASKQTETIREIMSLPYYKKLFGVEISGSSSAKDNFSTTAGGSVYAAGAAGTITGHGAGLRGCDTFGGAFIMDDMHKPAEVTSDVQRQTVIDWFYNTARSRMNDGEKTPIIFIGQRLHEDDLPVHLKETDGWKSVVLSALDVNNNPLDPRLHSKDYLFKMRETEPYSFASQYQQDPQPAGGGIFKKEWFKLMDIEPKILATFITVDTAETDKSYNDATVFSFFGLYKIIQFERETDLYGLHWIKCSEIRIEPKDLEYEFMQFYMDCMMFPVKPKKIAIEKKSTGVTLLSTLKNIQGMQILEIERTKASGNKTSRFLEMQPYIATKRVSLPIYANHTNMCLEHMRKITANDTHAHDDIADTLYDGVKLSLIDKTIQNMEINESSNSYKIVSMLNSNLNKINRLKAARYN
jgi:predicted phage terminase large subunit-like protein